jgi:hypothetical protein
MKPMNPALVMPAIICALLAAPLFTHSSTTHEPTAVLGSSGEPFGTVHVVPANVTARHVFGSIAFSASAHPAEADISVDGVIVETIQPIVTATQGTILPFAFSAPGGTSYWINDTSGSMSIWSESYVDG